MGLRKDQSDFAHYIGILIPWIESQGYQVTFGDAWAKSGHKYNSKHYIRLALDLNLFKDGVYLETTEAHRPIGEKWKSLNPNCTWGGDFPSPDGNHYSYKEF